jgi:hypothetical protein
MAHKKRRDLPTRLPGAPWMIWLLLYHIIEREQNAFLHNLVRILVLPLQRQQRTYIVIEQRSKMLLCQTGVDES